MASFNLRLDASGQIRRRRSSILIPTPTTPEGTLSSQLQTPAGPVGSWLDDPLTINQGMLDMAHLWGSVTVALCVVSIAGLLALCDHEAHQRLVKKFPRLSTIHGSNALAFAFSLALNTLSSIHASSLERRVLSTIMLYINLVAFISYSAMASLPLTTVVGNTGNPVFFMRFIEWTLTCPGLLFWASLVSCQTWRQALVNVVFDFAMILIGVSAPFMWPPLAFCAVLVAMAMFVYIMFHVFINFGKAMDPDNDGPMPPVPSSALNMMRWEIVLSWSIFPIMDSAIHLGLVDTQVGEAIICGADYAAKAGLAIIMTNCNLEQVTILIAEYLAKEQERTSELLNSILPKSVARQLAAGKNVEAERHPNVSILFSDIKGFTSISSTVEPNEVMAMLNLLLSKFDALCEKHDVYKVETIGDAYMVVSGLPEKKKIHADALADFALDMVETAHTVRSPSDGQPLQIRVGLHSGPVTSGVVGKMRPRYCLFGDTVNTASRMESTGIPDKIQFSQAFKDSLLAPDAYDILQRGLIEVKGKGMMVTYLLYRADAEGADGHSKGGLLTSSETESEDCGAGSNNVSDPERHMVVEENAAQPTHRTRSSSQVGRGRDLSLLSVNDDGRGTSCSPQRRSSLSQGARSRSVSPGNLSRPASGAHSRSSSPGPALVQQSGSRVSPSTRRGGSPRALPRSDNPVDKNWGSANV